MVSATVRIRPTGGSGGMRLPQKKKRAPISGCPLVRVRMRLIGLVRTDSTTGAACAPCAACVACGRWAADSAPDAAYAACGRWAADSTPDAAYAACAARALRADGESHG